MTGEDCIIKFREMVDDVLDADFEYQLLNDAKNEIEAMKTWEILKYEQAYSVTSGYSYTSALGTLPTRFALQVRMVEGTSDIPYDKVDFEDRQRKANHPFGYFIDLAANNLHLTGQNHSTKTIYFYYIKYSADITASTSWVFPDRFHSILPLKMAELYYLADAGERGRSWDDKWAEQYQRKLNTLLLWDDTIKMKGRRPSNHSRVMSPKANY